MICLKMGLKSNLLPLLVLCFLSLSSKAQVVTLNPAFATQNDQVTVIFAASKGNKALVGQSVVYAHTGVITTLSATPTSWKYVQGTWGTDDAKVKMTNLGGNLFSITYKINTFYGVPGGENILKLAFVFRNLNGSLVGRESDGADIFVPISNGTFQARFETNTAQIKKTNQSLTIKAVTSGKAAIKLYKNNVVVQSLADDSIITYTEAPNTNIVGRYNYIFEAVKNGNFYRDTIYAFYVGSPAIATAPVGTKDGVNYISDTSVIIQLHAPFKEYAFVVGDFNNWEFDAKSYMKKSPSGQKLWVQINGLTKGHDYRFQYVVDSTQIRSADVYSEKLLDQNNDPYVPAITYPNLPPYPTGKTTEYVSVLNTSKENFNWHHTDNFNRPNKEKLFIYELHLRDFIARHDFETLRDTLNYLKNLGINTIELMPINEFEGNESWGYNPAFYFSVDKYYGTKEAMKLFVDECHKLGMAVVLDMVLNHSFGQSPMVRLYFDKGTNKPTADNPWFNQTDKHPYGVGYDFNHESQATKDFVDTVLKFWIKEYRVDGFRFDLSKGFTQKNTGADVAAWGAYDASRIAIWKRIYNKVRTYDSTSYLILEHFADNSEEKELAAYGFLLWGNLNYNFNEATMGYVSTSNLSWADYKNRTWATPSVVVYAESHDEERLMYKNLQYGSVSGSYSIKNLNTALKRIEAAMCFLIPLQGPKMIWQFGELGYDYSIDFNGRVGNKPIHWDYLQNPNRKRVSEVVSILGWLKNTQPSYSTSNYTYTVSGAVKLYKVSDASLNTVCVGNFNIKTDSIIPVFQHTGWWYDIFTNDSVLVNDVSQKIVLGPGVYKFYVDKKIITPVVLTSIPKTINNNLNLEVYPNPVTEDVTINWDASEEPLNIEVYDVLGKLVFIRSINNLEGSITLSRNEMKLSTGTYILKCKQQNAINQQKIIIL